ncbi:rhomboid family intramembrane serine protease [Salsuginibacillus kocurii]|uniref:rhomboid family intramembrane serine protease n=1 Tax=Salsuginibacillus kocurii TaxID=427078 RepID=UPI0003654C9E|nr:rhomboid family intramembrane serine protease [Salsuginibacillus kocurii]
MDEEIMRQNHMYWQLVYHLAITCDMRIVNISKDNKQVWLEREDKDDPALFRIVKMDVIWSRELQKDLDSMPVKFRQIRKQMPLRKPDLYNVYVTSYPPVDEAGPLLEQDRTAGQTPIKSYLLPAIPNRWHTLDEVKDFVASAKCEKRFYPEGFTWHEEDTARLRQEVKDKHKQATEKDREFFLFGKPLFTTTLLIIIALIFMYMETVDDTTSVLTLIEFGAKYNPAIIEGEWWRLGSAMFLHIGFLHFFMNSLALFYLGGAVERIFGTTRFILIYILAGLIGSIASFAFNDQISAGASGAIFGCFGALLYFGSIHRKLFFRTMGLSVIVILVINLAFGFMVPMVDNGAHIGGLVGGFLASAAVHLPKHGLKWRQPVILLLTGVGAIGLFIFGLQTEDGEMAGMIQLQISQELLEEGQYEEAYELITSAIEEGEDSAEAYFLQGNAEAQLAMFEEARESYFDALEQRADFHEAYYNLALVYVELGDKEEASTYVNEAIAIQEQEEYERLKQHLQNSMDE